MKFFGSALLQPARKCFRLSERFFHMLTYFSGDEHPVCALTQLDDRPVESIATKVLS